MATPAPAVSAATRDTRRILRTAYLRLALVLICFAGLGFAVAGRWDLPMVWIYFATSVIFVITVLVIIGRKDPDLLRERFQPGPGARDPKTRPLLLAFILSHWIVAGLDVGRYHWSGAVPFALQLAALLFFALGLAGWGWAMYANRFFSSEVRIQTERGHHVITGGPYRIVRHPGYAVLLVFFLASPVVLGSWWALLPVLGAAALILRRTVIEDRVLRAELPGYEEYAARVRYRLLPAVWYFLRFHFLAQELA